MEMEMKIMNKYSSISHSMVTYSFGVVLGVASPLQLLVMTVGTNNDTLIIIIIFSILLLKYEGA